MSFPTSYTLNRKLPWFPRKARVTDCLAVRQRGYGHANNNLAAGQHGRVTALDQSTRRLERLTFVYVNELRVHKAADQRAAS